MPFAFYETFSGGSVDYNTLTSYTNSQNQSYSFSTFSSSTSASSSSEGGSLFAVSPFFDYKTSFSESVGILVTNSDVFTTYYFSDFTDYTFGVPRYSSTENTLGTYYIRSTSETTLSNTIYSIDTTWTDVTTTSVATTRAYTDVSEYDEYPLLINLGGGQSFGVAPEFTEQALIVLPVYGQSWTQDGPELQYLQIFASTGSHGPYHTNIIKDNDLIEQTFAADKTLLSYNEAVALGGTGTQTVISSSAQTVTYDALVGASSILSFQKQYSLNGAQFETNSAYPSTISINRLEKQSSSFSQVVQSEYLVDKELDIASYSVGLYTSTRPIQVSTTDTFYAIDQALSYFSSFTYRGIINTTSAQTYVVYNGGIFGVTSSYYSESTFTYQEASTVFFSSAYAYKGFYTLPIGAIDDNWRKYYTQYSPNFNFVVGGASDSIGDYKSALTPESLITKLFFTTYKFERSGVVKVPTLAVPIDFTRESTSGTASSYTTQSVSIPDGFYSGSAAASVSWTMSVFGQPPIPSQSFTISYIANNTILTMGKLSQNDFFGGAGGVPYAGGIYHTRGLVNINSGAGWSQDGYYYWSVSGTPGTRSTNGANTNPISVIGNGMPITFVASCLTTSTAYPVAFALKNYANSYSYSY